jgi:prevent-host-death family protein
MTEEVGAARFKATCLELMDRVSEKRETYVITKHGRPVAKLVPADPVAPQSPFGCMAEDTRALGDLEEPLFSDRAWEAFARRFPTAARARTATRRTRR